MGITKHFANVGPRQVHYRRAGSGPAVVLLHPAPLSSRIFDPLIEALADDYTAFALDRAGFGLSERLDHQRPEIADYADALRDELDAIGIGTAAFYGSATGSVVGTEFARRYPERVESLILENLPLVTEEEAAYMIRHYAPRFRPLWEGGHIPYLWTVAHDIHAYWPWSRRELAARRDVDMPELDAVRQTFLDLLLVGEQGHLAYDAVWRNRPGVALRQLTVPTTVLCREDSVMTTYLDAYPTSDTVRVRVTPRDPEFVELWHSHPRIIKGLIDERRPAGAAPAILDPGTIPGRVARSYVAVRGGRLCVRWLEEAPGRPLVLLPGPPGCGRGLEPLLRELGRARPVVAIDLPGVGDSAALGATGATVDGEAAAIVDALDALGLAEVDLLGEGLAAALAVEVALRDSTRVRSLVLLGGVPLPSSDERDDLLARYTVSLEPAWDGGHLMRGWYLLRASTLFSPWYARTREAIVWREPPSAEELHERFVDLMKADGTYGAGVLAALRHPTAERLAGLRLPALVIGPNQSPLACDERAASLLPGARFEPLPATPAEVAALVSAFLAAPRA